MARLREKYVQDVAVKWLDGYYRESKGAQAVVWETEVWVDSHTKLGSGRADGLAVAALSDGTIHVASLEAKSWKRLPDVRVVYKDARLLRHAVVAGVIGLVGAAYVGRSVGAWLLVWVFPIIAFFAVGFAFVVAANDLNFYHLVDAVDQVRRYPGNDQWLALSSDVYNILDTEQRRLLRKHSQEDGVGLVRVSAGEKVTLIQAPKSQHVPRGYEDFLACYVRADSIRSKLQEKLHKAGQYDALGNVG